MRASVRPRVRSVIPGLQMAKKSVASVIAYPPK
jgi:hypothetical protein